MWICADIQKAFSAPGRPKFKYEDESDGEEEDIFVQKKKMKTQHTASSSAVIDLTAEGDVKGEIKQVSYTFITLYLIHLWIVCISRCELQFEVCIWKVNIIG